MRNNLYREIRETVEAFLTFAPLTSVKALFEELGWGLVTEAGNCLTFQEQRRSPSTPLLPAITIYTLDNGTSYKLW